MRTNVEHGSAPLRATRSSVRFPPLPPSITKFGAKLHNHNHVLYITVFQYALYTLYNQSFLLYLDRYNLIREI